MNRPTASRPSPSSPAPRLRPTLVIGLGGTGHRVVLRLKALAEQGWEPERTRGRLKFLVFDTSQEFLTLAYDDRTVALEPGSEFIAIGETPVANIKRNLDRQTAIRERLGRVMASLPPVVLLNGAKQLRPLGLLAFLWRYAEVERRLRDAIWELAGRQQAEGREGINVFIVNSLVGGTGSSTYLDVAHLVRDLFDELGALADFCYVTGVGVLPRAFHGIQGPNLVPNAVASLKELNHCMMRGGFTVRYPNGRVITTLQPPFNIYYLVDGVDERGHTWHGLNEVCWLVAEALFLQMGSQVGRKQENDFDNLDDVLVQQTEEGVGTFYGSFGLASLLFSGPAVARACAARHAIQLIEQHLLAPSTSALADRPAGSEALDQWVDDFVEAAGVDLPRLTERLARDDQGLPLSVELTVPGWADRLPARSAPAELVRYVRDYERIRLGTDFRRWLSQNEALLAEEAEATLTDHLTRLARRAGLPPTESFLKGVLHRLDEAASRLSARQAEREGQQAELSRELARLETVFLQAGEGSFLGRSRRVSRARQTYFAAAQRLFRLRWHLQVTAAALALLNRLSRAARDHLAACQETALRLKAVHRALQEVATRFDDGQAQAGVTTRSLADEVLVAALFRRHAPPPADTLATLFSDGASPLDWQDAPPERIQAALLAACRPPFASVAAMSVEEAIALRAEKATPEGYYRWLMDQATPSWNLDHTRLPDGGANLQRLEVLGVPDETNTLYRHHATTLVSTNDRTRLIAFVAHIGAPHTALQQWESYQATYEQARGRVPLHVLPQFQTDGEQARQAFALGFLFGFIRSQGAAFDYVPADRLERPTRLGRDLDDALRAFARRDDLVQETWERVEQWVASRGIEATLRTLTAYYRADDHHDLADDLVLELKRLVRAYADRLRQIHQFALGPPSPEAREGWEQEGRQDEP